MLRRGQATQVHSTLKRWRRSSMHTHTTIHEATDPCKHSWTLIACQPFKLKTSQEGSDVALHCFSGHGVHFSIASASSLPSQSAQQRHHHHQDSAFPFLLHSIELIPFTTPASLIISFFTILHSLGLTSSFSPHSPFILATKLHAFFSRSASNS